MTLSQAEKRFLVGRAKADPDYFWESVLGCPTVYDKRGRLRILCANGGSPVTGKIKLMDSDWTLFWYGQPVESRWTPCLECDCWIRVVGPKSKPRLRVHNSDAATAFNSLSDADKKT